MLLRAENIEKRYIRESSRANFFFAVEPVSLALKEGALIVMTGRSGSGKTTLLQMLGGMLAPTAGQIQAGDVNLYSLKEKELSEFRNRHIGVIPQGQAAVHSLNVLENIILPRQLYGISPGTMEKDARDFMDQLGIGDLARVMPGELSGGELRRMSIARAMMNHPEILLADEPTGDLDDRNSEQVLRMFRELADKGTTILLVTHETESIRFADEVWQMEAGKLKKEEKLGMTM